MVDAAPGRVAEESTERRRIPRPPVLWLTIALVAVPFVAMVISLVGHPWHPVGDQAIELLRIRDVGGRYTPLLGAPSRWGWAHPGPLLFWTLTPFYRVLGTDGVLVGVAAINLAAAVGFVVVAYRRGGELGAVIGGLAVVLIARGIGPDLLVDPWNPWVAFLPFVCFLGLVWLAVCGDAGALAIAVGVGSFVVQAHFGYLPLVAGLLVGSAAVLAVRSRRRGPLLIAGLVGVICWAPVLLQEAIGSPRNLSALAHFVRHPNEAVTGWSTAFGIMGTELRPVGPWIGDRETLGWVGTVRTGSVWWAIATIVAVAVAGWWARKRGSGGAARLAAVVLVAIAIALVATSRVTGIRAPYVLRWWRGIAALAYLSIAWSVLFGLGKRRILDLAKPVAMAGIVAVVALQLVQLPARAPEAYVSTAIGAVTAPTAAALDRNERYLVRAIDRITFAAPQNGLFLALHLRGYHVFGDRTPDRILTFGNRFTATADDVDGIVTMVSLRELAEGWHAPGDSRIVATFRSGNRGYKVFLTPT
jgi:hypothetical protein